MLKLNIIVTLSMMEANCAMRSELCLVFIVVFPLFLVGSVKLLERMLSALCLVMFPCLFLVGSAGL